MHLVNCLRSHIINREKCRKCRAVVGLIIVSLLLLAVRANAVEADYQMKWCNERQGMAEVVLADETRVDCVVNGEAVEFDFAKKWYEAIGQSLHYAALTGLRPAIVLIVKEGDDKDRQRVDSAKRVVEKFGLPITLYTVQGEEK